MASVALLQGKVIPAEHLFSWPVVHQTCPTKTNYLVQPCPLLQECTGVDGLMIDKEPGLLGASPMTVANSLEKELESEYEIHTKGRDKLCATLRWHCKPNFMCAACGATATENEIFPI